MKRAITIISVSLGLWLLYEQRPINSRIRISKETTDETEPLLDDGLPDYSGNLLAQLGDGVTPENNGAIPLLQAMWPAGLEPEHQVVICRDLGMDVPSDHGMAMLHEDEELGQALEEWLLPGGESWRDERLGEDAEQSAARTEAIRARNDGVERLLALVQHQPWKREQAPAVADWVAAHRAQYDLLHAAVGKTHFYLPWPGLLLDPKQSWVFMDFAGLGVARKSAICLQVRARLRCGEGDLEGAWRDCRAIYELADRVPPTTLVEGLVSAAIEGIGNNLVLHLFEHPKLSLRTAEQMLSYLSSRPLKASVAESLNHGERRFFITTMLAWSRHREPNEPLDNDEAELSPFAARRINWNVVLGIGNEWYDQLVEAARLPKGAAHDEAWDHVFDELDSMHVVNWRSRIVGFFNRSARSQLIARKMLSMMTPATSAAEHAEYRQNVHRRLLTAAAALAVYRTRNGEYPETLGVLTPSLLPKSPTDLNESPLAYRKTENGYLLYSMGNNLSDDQGCNNSLDWQFFGYRVSQGYDPAGWDEALVKALGMENDESLFDEETGEFELPILDEADDYAIRLPQPRLEWPRPDRRARTSNGDTQDLNQN